MNNNQNTSEMPDMKVRISALWLFAMLTYTSGDVVTLMDPVKHGSVQLTEAFLLGGSIYMMIPIMMVLLSRILKYRVFYPLNESEYADILQKISEHNITIHSSKNPYRNENGIMIKDPDPNNINVSKVKT